MKKLYKWLFIFNPKYSLKYERSIAGMANNDFRNNKTIVLDKYRFEVIRLCKRRKQKSYDFKISFSLKFCMFLFSFSTMYSQDTICLDQETYSHIYNGLKQGEYYKAEYKNCLEVSTHLHELNKQLADSLTLNIEKLEESYYDNDLLKHKLEQKTPWYKKWYVLLTAGIITGILIN